MTALANSTAEPIVSQADYNVPYNVVEDIMLSPIDRDMEKAFQTS
jgi:hypothetical protein